MPHPRIWASTYSEKPALLMAGSGQHMSYAALESRANQLAHFLRAQNLQRGDAIAVLMENNLHFMQIFWAAQRAGLYLVPVSWRLKDAEVAYILENSGAKLLFTSWQYQHLAPGLCVDDPYYESAISGQPTTPIADESLGRDMMYSSGTTGRPKGVKTALPNGEITSLMPVMAFMSSLYGFNEHSIFLSTSPLYHAAGLRYCMVAGHAGATAIIMERFDAEQTLALIERHRVTHVSLVPTMFVRLLKLPAETRARYDLSSLKWVIHGTGPCGRDVKQAMLDWLGPILFENYGATEGNGLCALDSREWLAHPGAVGKAVVGKLHILDAEFRECAAGEDGLVYFEGGPRFEYHRDPEKTAQAYSPQGWSTLGDIGHLDAEGYLYLTDRQSHMIISGGVNIYPQEVEDLLLAHPDVLDAAVFGIPDAEYGETVMAAVHAIGTPDPGLERELIAYCRDRLAGYKCPRRVVFSTDLPRHETGKIYKRLLRQRYAEAADAV